MDRSRSEELFARACGVMPGGVNSPVRAFKSVGGNPLFIARAAGCRVTDVDGNDFIDYVGSWGPMILGHAHPDLVEAVKQAVERGASFGAPTELEVELAEEIIDAVPSIEMVRLVNSGTEAVMSAIRLARAFTGRDRVVKFEGCYHGHSDGLLSRAGSGLATLGIPDSPGVPAAFAGLTHTVPFNEVESLRDLFAERGDEIAVVVVEPVAGNMGCIPPEPGFLQALREITSRAGALLLFDEVMTGFRLARGGAQEKYGVLPDLTALGKVVGGGFPLAAYGGRKEIMERMAPAGPVYQAGTLSGNPVAVSAGLAQLRLLRDPEVYRRLEALGLRLETGLREALRLTGFDLTLNRAGSMFTLFFTGRPVRNFSDAASSDTSMFGAYFRAMLERGIYLAPSQFEAAFLGAAHSEADLALTIAAAGEVLERMRSGQLDEAR